MHESSFPIQLWTTNVRSFYIVLEKKKSSSWLFVGSVALRTWQDEKWNRGSWGSGGQKSPEYQGDALWPHLSRTWLQKPCGYLYRWKPLLNKLYLFIFILFSLQELALCGRRVNLLGRLHLKKLSTALTVSLCRMRDFNWFGNASITIPILMGSNNCFTEIIADVFLPCTANIHLLY